MKTTCQTQSYQIDYLLAIFFYTLAADCSSVVAAADNANRKQSSKERGIN